MNDYPLNVPVAGNLQRSGEEFPSVVAHSSTAAGISTTLYRGLPDAIHGYPVIAEPLSADLALTPGVLDGTPAVAGLVVNLALAGQEAAENWRALAVLGTSEEHRAQQFAKLSGYSAEQALAAARVVPSDPSYQPAPILLFRSGYLKGEVPSPDASHCNPPDPSVACSTALHAERQSQTVNWALARDSKGVPWAVAGIVTEDRWTQPQYGYRGELCVCNVLQSVANVTVELRLFRRAFPSTERSVVLAENQRGRHRLTLDMDGAQGTLAQFSDDALGTAALWRIDLDSL